jgi:hypothetical protein
MYTFSIIGLLKLNKKWWLAVKVNGKFKRVIESLWSVAALQKLQMISTRRSDYTLNPEGLKAYI